MQVGNLLHKWNAQNDQACNKLPTSFQLVRLVGCGLYATVLCPSVRLWSVCNVCIVAVGKTQDAIWLAIER